MLMLGVSGVMISSASFGFSRSLPVMLISRSVAGALSGNVAVANSLLSEITDETNQGKGKHPVGSNLISTLFHGAMLLHSSTVYLNADTNIHWTAFPLLGATWYIGCIMSVIRVPSILLIAEKSLVRSGPILGGHLSNPVKKWPDAFAHYPIFQSYVSSLNFGTLGLYLPHDLSY